MYNTVVDLTNIFDVKNFGDGIFFTILRLYYVKHLATEMYYTNKLNWLIEKELTAQIFDSAHVEMFPHQP